MLLFILVYKVLSLSRTTRRSTLVWRRIYSDEDQQNKRSKALSPVAPTKKSNQHVLGPGLVLAKSVLGFPISMTT